MKPIRPPWEAANAVEPMIFIIQGLIHELWNYVRFMQEAGFAAQGTVHFRIAPPRADDWQNPEITKSVRILLKSPRSVYRRKITLSRPLLSW